MVLIGSAGLVSIETLARETTCRIRAPFLSLALQPQGYTWRPGEEEKGRCELLEPRWRRGAVGEQSIFVHADGPTGSGRLWLVAVGIGRSGHAPSGGTCFLASTVGWRTLREYKRLHWIDDLDRDNKHELVIWGSFPLRRHASLSDYGLIGWVYQLQGDRFILDRRLTRKVALSIAKAYTLRGKRFFDPAPRTRAAELLRELAYSKCTVAANGATR